MYECKSCLGAGLELGDGEDFTERIQAATGICPDCNGSGAVLEVSEEPEATGFYDIHGDKIVAYDENGNEIGEVSEVSPEGNTTDEEAGPSVWEPGDPAPLPGDGTAPEEAGEPGQPEQE